jgi:hypothetical protein
VNQALTTNLLLWELEVERKLLLPGGEAVVVGSDGLFGLIRGGG